MNTHHSTYILKYLRGQSDIKTFSKKIDFDYYRYSKIEGGYTKLNMTDFFKICEKCKFPIEEIIYDSLHVKLKKLDQKNLISEALTFWNIRCEKKLYKRMGFSKEKWWRVKNNHSRMDFIDFISFVEEVTGRSEKFLSYFMEQNMNENVNVIILNLLRKYPSFSIMLSLFTNEAYLKLKSVRLKKEFLLKICGFSDCALDEIIEEFNKVGIKLFQDEGELVNSMKLLRPERDIHHKLSQFILKKHIEKYQDLNARQRIINVPIVASINKNDLAKINDLTAKFMQDLSDVIESSSSKDELFYMYIGHVIEGISQNQTID